jgi:hypothetical protein
MRLVHLKPICGLFWLKGQSLLIMSRVRVLDWKIGFIDTLYTPLRTTGNYSTATGLHTLQFFVTDISVLSLLLSTHFTVLCYRHQCPQSITISTIRFLAMDFNIGTITVSLNYTKYHCTVAHIKSYLHSQTFNSTELHSTILMPFLNATPSLPSSYPGRLGSWNSTDLLPFLHNHLWLLSPETRSIFIRYIASGRLQQKTPFPNNPSIVLEVSLPCCFIETVVLLLPSFPREPVYRVFAWLWISTLAPLFWLSGIKSQ